MQLQRCEYNPCVSVLSGSEPRNQELLQIYYSTFRPLTNLTREQTTPQVIAESSPGVCVKARQSRRWFELVELLTFGIHR